VKDKYEVICYWDNKKKGAMNGIPIERPNLGRIFDILFIASSHDGIEHQLDEMGIPKEKRDRRYIDHPYEVRNNWLRCYSDFLKKMEIYGCVAEAGVYKGDFAAHINKNFKNSICYLFDTFSGFSEEDIKLEQEMKCSIAEIGQFGDTSEDYVLNRMPYRDMVKTVKGIFPGSALKAGISEKFIFVNLDMDLYRPTIEGLKFFSGKMKKYGVILVHDYFTNYEGINKAVHEFLSKRNDLLAVPIGDEMSIAIVGFDG